MHRTIGGVFKVLGISIVLMILMDVSLVVIDRVTANNRIDTVMRLMADELARNNSIPDDIAPMLDKSLHAVVEKSNIAVDIKWNLNNSETVDGVTYTPINSANVKQNGEIAYLVVKVKYQPHSILFDMKGAEDEQGTKIRKNVYTQVDAKVVPVPMLRYLK